MTLTPYSSCFSPAPSSYLHQTTPMPMPVAPHSNSQSKSIGSNTIAHDDIIIQSVGEGRMDIPCAFWLDFHRRRDVPPVFYCTPVIWSVHWFSFYFYRLYTMAESTVLNLPLKWQFLGPSIYGMCVIKIRIYMTKNF